MFGVGMAVERGLMRPLQHAPHISLAMMTVALSYLFKGISRFRSEEHTSELQSLMRISYAVFCLKKKKQQSHPYLHTIISVIYIHTIDITHPLYHIHHNLSYTAKPPR